jgi:hypothetical protein
MSNLRDFLNWFEGFSDNLDKAPTAKQWEKIKERLLALKDEPEAAAAPQAALPVQPVAVPAGVDPDPRGTTVVAKWRAAVKTLLMDTYDEADANDELAKIPVDLNREPAEVVAKFLNGTGA